MRVAMRQEELRWAMGDRRSNWFRVSQSSENEERLTSRWPGGWFNHRNMELDRKMLYYPNGRGSTNFCIWCENQKIVNAAKAGWLQFPRHIPVSMRHKRTAMPGSISSLSWIISQLIPWPKAQLKWIPRNFNKEFVVPIWKGLHHLTQKK